MRKRIRLHGVKLLSCSGKKLMRLAFAMCAVVCMSSCATSQQSTWEMYCEKYGVSVDNPSREEENTYLDCYVGSMEEEWDLEHGVEYIANFDTKYIVGVRWEMHKTCDFADYNDPQHGLANAHIWLDRSITDYWSLGGAKWGRLVGINGVYYLAKK